MLGRAGVWSGLADGVETRDERSSHVNRAIE
jgi:hypothetical protein